MGLGTHRRALVVAFTLAIGCSRSTPAPPATKSAPAAAASAATSDTSDATEKAAAADGGAGGRASSAAEPFGRRRVSERAPCAGVALHVAKADLQTSFAEGDDLLALVNRSPTGALPPDYAPSDLVDIRNGKPMAALECESLHCLRKEAADALRSLLAEMKKLGFPGKVESAFRSYAAQCGTFLNWARKGSFCDATEQSALPGHSQHQLGTTVDLFTEEWAKDERGVFRNGFGCTPAGAFLRERAWEHGFVMPYPIHPDDRHPKQACVTRWDIPVGINPKTGYRYEHWHIRYVGKEAAARFSRAWKESGPDTPGELTVEQWLRSERGLSGADAELPVCDGCNCGACSTLSPRGESTCDAKGGALHLGDRGTPLPAPSLPELTEIGRIRTMAWPGRMITAKVTVPAGTLTQPPITGRAAAGYDDEGASFERLAPYPKTEPRAFPVLEGAWALAVEPIPNATGIAWPWRAALTLAKNGSIYNRANVLLPATPGTLKVEVPVPAGVTRVKVTLLEGGVPRGTPTELELR
jgi:zinc D-Ala-D-Ala carboxypeptidase